MYDSLDMAMSCLGTLPLKLCKGLLMKILFEFSTFSLFSNVNTGIKTFEVKLRSDMRPVCIDISSRHHSENDSLCLAYT